MKKTISEVATEYTVLAILEGEAKLSGDYKKGNRLVKKMNKLISKISQDPGLMESVIREVLKSPSDRARALISADALRLGLCVDEAVVSLTEVAQRRDIIGFGSKMTLKIWRGEIPGKTL